LEEDEMNSKWSSPTATARPEIMPKVKKEEPKKGELQMNKSRASLLKKADTEG